MKTKILFAIFTLCAAVCFTSCISTENQTNSGGNVNLPTTVIYELSVNNSTWQIYDSKITLTDNAEQNPESYTYDYTITIIAADASNQVNADSKTLNFNFDANSIEDFKNENLATSENFHLLYRGKMETKASRYNYVSGRMTITEIGEKSMSIVFNNLKMKADGSNLLLPGEETPEMTINGAIKCVL
ncbi:MAG: hypothetical protein IKV33_07245 [Alistipes sp.]|nr:hypothetical protein [Alistipes sp.]